MKLILACFSLFLHSQNSFATDFLNDIDAYEENGIYHISISSRITASAEHVRHVLTDYIHIYRLNDSIIESEVLTPSENNNIRVRTVILFCIPLFCKEVVRVEEVSKLKSGDIHTKIIPEKSDFYSGNATWKITPKDDATQLSYQATLEPSFFIPPFIGTEMVINNLRKDFSTTFYRIQHIARINETRQWHDDYEHLEPLQK